MQKKVANTFFSREIILFKTQVRNGSSPRMSNSLNIDVRAIQELQSKVIVALVSFYFADVYS